MRRSPRFALVLLFVSVVAGGFSPQEAAAQEIRPAAIHPWVWDHTADGTTADFFVVLREQADLSGAEALETKDEKGWYVYQALTSVAARTQKPILDRLAAAKVDAQPFWIVNEILVVKGDRKLALEMASRPDVVRIDGNPTIRMQLPKPENGFDVDSVGPIPEAVQWNVTTTNAPGVWSLGFRGAGIVVGAQDTGYRWTHVFIKSKYRGWDGTTANHDYNWHDSVHSGGVGGTCTGPNSAAPCDDDGHGTHTMGTVLGDNGTGNEYGMAPSAKWIGCRDMNLGAGTPALYTECFQWFLAPTKIDGTGADPTKAPDVTSNSWGCPTSEGCAWDTLQSAADAQKAAGIMTVAAAGNSGSSCSTITDAPAMYASVFTVGSTTSSNAMSSFSSRGPGTGNALMKPEIVAPGSNVTSATNTSDTATATLSGTSMATPNVAGGVALFWSARPAYKNKWDATAALLECSATKLTSITEACGGNYTTGPNNTWGYGLLNVLAAVNAAIPPATGLTATPNGNNRIDLSWSASAGATAYRVYRSTSSSGPWSQVGSVTAPTTTWSDNPVTGGVLFYYVVRAVSTCEVLDSNQASATASGSCTYAPSFAGLASATNNAVATCTISLSWAAGTAQCAGSGSPKYNVYRSTSSSFTPAAGNRIATSLATTGYTDSVGLTGGTAWYYIVRAVDAVNGYEDSNLVTKSAVPTGPASTGTWTDDAGDTGAAKMILGGSWAVAATGGKTGPKVYATGTYAASSCLALTTPVLQLGTGSALSFQSKYDLETGWDAGILEIATGPTFASWSKLPITTYPNSLNNGGNSCSFATSGANTVFSQTNATPVYAASPYTASLSAWNGQQVQIRWRLGSDTSVQGAGWWVDDISITNVMVGGSCTTGTATATKPVPDGLFVAGTPMKGKKNGSAVDLTWDVGTCSSPDFNLYRGAIGNWTAVTGGSCALGTGGSKTNLTVPGDTWWVVAGAGATDVGSFGRASGNIEESFTGWSGVCTQTTQSLGASCP